MKKWGYEKRTLGTGIFEGTTFWAEGTLGNEGTFIDTDGTMGIKDTLSSEGTLGTKNIILGSNRSSYIESALGTDVLKYLCYWRY